MPEIQPHQQRVIDEHNEVEERVGKLQLFIDTNPVFTKLHEEDQYLLQMQRLAMNMYLQILDRRVERFWKK